MGYKSVCKSLEKIPTDLFYFNFIFCVWFKCRSKPEALLFVGLQASRIFYYLAFNQFVNSLL